jgi:predicted Fe-Mo cluster-binding NifX family protein
MIAAVSASGASLDDRVHSQFGRCDYFLVVDTESLDMHPVINTFASAATGAGTACAQIMFDEKVQGVISGQVGPNAYEVLVQAGIDIFLCPPGLTVREAIDRLNRSELQKMELQRF